MTQALGYVLDDVFLQHRAPSGHPERPARAEAVRDALTAAGIASRGRRIVTRPATDEELARVHSAAYLDGLLRTVPGQTGWLDADTYYSPGTWDAARAAAGSTTQLALDVLHGELAHGISVVRPPGHHATRDRAMGFCLLNNVAAAAAAARANGAARVAILDWDVHHGNGTQDIFWDDPDVLYMSVHQFPFYPGTGAPTEIGGPGALGATVNVGLPSGCGDAEYAAVFDHVFLPKLAQFRPTLLLISAGFDAFQHDPLAGMKVTHAGFAAMAHRLRAAANLWSEGRVVAVLEGGYDLDGLSGGMAAVLAAFVEPTVLAVPAVALPAHPVARAAIEGTLAAHRAAGVAIGG
ncbi:MAG TPA: histone deacetylase [Kofleriaceae bacterium]|jgi:acetoin utilization deacetylase AcuC-like enzyme|nr:histone deacetylase [Kofleriaceae bacterium]